MKRFIIPSVIVFALLAGCTKAPERLESPGAAIRAVIENNTLNFVLTIRAGITNSNSGAALMDYRGEIILKDGGKRLPKPFGAIPFSVAAIFPFETASVVVEMRGSEHDFKPIFDLFEIQPDDIVKSGSTDDIFINEKYIELKTVSYRKERIEKLIQGKADEKDK